MRRHILLGYIRELTPGIVANMTGGSGMKYYEYGLCKKVITMQKEGG